MSFEDRLLDEIQTRFGEEIDRQSNGLESAQDWPDYKRRVGVINGLRMALGIVRDTAKHVNQ
jgi:hypothetical protein